MTVPSLMLIQSAAGTLATRDKTLIDAEVKELDEMPTEAKWAVARGCGCDLLTAGYLLGLETARVAAEEGLKI